MRDFSDRYLEYLTGPLAGINLTRITDPEEFYYKQIVDSVKPFDESELFQKKCKEKGLVVDIGFGGGFPILPLAYKNEKIRFIGMEARNKKVSAVNSLKSHLGIDNVTLLHQRYEKICFDKDVVITFKAVGKLSDLLKRINTTKEIYVFFYKGPKFYEEENLDEIKKEWEIVEEKEFAIPHTEGRLLIGLKNKKVPRGTFKNLVNLSEII